VCPAISRDISTLFGPHLPQPHLSLRSKRSKAGNWPSQASPRYWRLEYSHVIGWTPYSGRTTSSSLSSTIQLLALLSTFSYLSQTIAVSLLATRTDTSSTPNSLLTQAGFLNRCGRDQRRTYRCVLTILALAICRSILPYLSMFAGIL
jgi:hypothetical protein